jgi:hypothetical protein
MPLCRSGLFSHNLRGTPYCIKKNTADGTAGQYAGVMNWENVTLDETTTLNLTVEGQLGADNYGDSYYAKAAINAMIITRSGGTPSALLILHFSTITSPMSFILMGFFFTAVSRSSED